MHETFETLTPVDLNIFPDKREVILVVEALHILNSDVIVVAWIYNTAFK